jgi:hypothetical protein
MSPCSRTLTGTGCSYEKAASPDRSRGSGDCGRLESQASLGPRDRDAPARRRRKRGAAAEPAQIPERAAAALASDPLRSAEKPASRLIDPPKTRRQRRRPPHRPELCPAREGPEPGSDGFPVPDGSLLTRGDSVAERPEAEEAK